VANVPGFLTVRPKVITAAQIASPYDVTFLSVKSYNLAGAIDDFAPAVGPRTVIIPVLNGMRHIDVLTERFGKDAVLGGVCYVATEMDCSTRPWRSWMKRISLKRIFGPSSACPRHNTSTNLYGFECVEERPGSQWGREVMEQRFVRCHR
jgi:2-dehydropantoate 2-reductase